MHSSHSVKVYSIPPIEEAAVITHAYSAGARACLGRRCEVLRLLESGVLINFFQVFRNRGRSRHDYAGVKV